MVIKSIETETKEVESKPKEQPKEEHKWWQFWK